VALAPLTCLVHLDRANILPIGLDDAQPQAGNPNIEDRHAAGCDEP